jgi:hypothetical protein
MNQVAMLPYRGAMLTRDLTKEEEEKCLSLFNKVISDPMYSKVSRSIAKNLKDKIQNEYKDMNCGKQEAQIAVWRGVLHSVIHKPNKIVQESEEDRRRFFKTFMWKFYIQILTENKLPSRSVKKKFEGPPLEVAKNVLDCTLGLIKFDGVPLKYTIEENSNAVIFNINTFEIPKTKIKKLNIIVRRYKKHNININILFNSIWITKGIGGTKEVINDYALMPERVKSVSFNYADKNQNEEDSPFKNQIELSAIKHNNIRNNPADLCDKGNIIDCITKRLHDETSKKVMCILSTMPEDFTNKYGTSTPIKPAHIAEYLGISKNKTKKIMDKIKMLYMGVGIA